MADRYYGINRGENDKTDVTEDSSTLSKDIEVVVDLTNSPSREQVILGLQGIIAYLTNSTWPPA